MPARKKVAKSKPKARTRPKPGAKPKARSTKATPKKATPKQLTVAKGAGVQKKRMRWGRGSGVAMKTISRIKWDYRNLATTSFNRIVHPVTQKATVVPGLLKPLKSAFFPDVQAPRTTARKWRAMSKKDPKETGIRVHREIEMWANCELPEKRRLHSYSKGIIDALMRMGLRPVASELALVSKQGCYFTHSDLICRAVRVDGSEELVVVSLKTGYSRAAAAGSTRCRGACSKLRNTDQNFHIMQIACEIYCMRHEYGVDVSRGVIIYAGYGAGKSVVKLDLPQWAYSQSFMSTVHDELFSMTPPATQELFTKLRTGEETA